MYNLVHTIDSLVVGEKCKAMLKTYFRFLSSLSPTKLDEYRQNIYKEHFRDMISSLSVKSICSNCNLVFSNMNALGSKQCFTHPGKLTNKGYGQVWSCCEALTLDRKLPVFPKSYRDSRFGNGSGKKEENSHFATGCTRSDHWDKYSVQKTSTESITIAGYSKESILTLPFLIYGMVIFDKACSRAPLVDVISMLQSIRSITIRDTLRTQTIDPLVNRTNRFKKSATETQRSYDPFYKSSTNDQSFTSTDMCSVTGVLGSDDVSGPQMVREYVANLIEPGGLIVIEESVRNGTIPYKQAYADEFLLQHIMLMDKDGTGPISNNNNIHQDVLVWDLLFTLVDVKRLDAA